MQAVHRRYESDATDERWSSMLRTEMPWYIKLGTAILATAFGGGCIIAILLVLPTGLAWDLGNWLRQPMLEERRIRTLVGGLWWRRASIGLTGGRNFPDEERQPLTSWNQGAGEILRIADLSGPRS